MTTIYVLLLISYTDNWGCLKSYEDGDSSIIGTVSNNHYIHDRPSTEAEYNYPEVCKKPELYGDKKEFHVRLESRRRDFDKL